MKTLQQLMIAVAILMAFQAAAIAQSTMYGTYLDVNNEWVLISIDQNTGAPAIIGPTGQVGNPVILVANDNDGQLYAVSPQAQLFSVNTATGLVTQTGTIAITAPTPISGFLSIAAVAFNNADGKVYAVSQRIVGFFNTVVELLEVDLASGNATIIAAFSDLGVAELVFSNGTAYASNNSADVTYPVDITTGVVSAAINRQEFVVKYASEPTAIGNNVYAIRYDQQTVGQDLVTVNPATGITQSVIGPLNIGPIAGRQVASITVLTPSATPVPTVGEWALIVLGSTFLLFGLMMIRRLG